MKTIARPGQVIPFNIQEDLGETVAAIESITPLIAAAYLETSKGNRPLNPQHIERLRARMQSGRWEPRSPMAISFDDQGNLIDGHHRLHAIIRLGYAVSVRVMRGVAATALDQYAKPRSATDQAYFEEGPVRDILVTHGHAAVVQIKRLANFIATYVVAPGHSARVDSEFLDLLMEYHSTSFLELLDVCKGHKHACAAPCFAALVLLQQAKAVGVCEFTERLIDGLGQEQGSPVMALRDHMFNPVRRHGEQPPATASKVIHSYRAFAEGRYIKRLQAGQDPTGELVELCNRTFLERAGELLGRKNRPRIEKRLKRRAEAKHA